MKFFFLITSLSIILFSCIDSKLKKLPFYGQYDVVYKDNTEIEDTIYPKIPSFSFTNQDSVLKNSNIQYKNKILIADFFFTSCPTICPKMTKQMKRLNKMTDNFNEKLQFISFTINPNHDKPNILKKYIEKYKITSKNWDFLCGDEDETHRLGVENFLVFAHKDIKSEGGYAHSPAFVLVDKNRYVRGVYIGTEPKEVDRLANDIKILINE